MFPRALIASNGVIAFGYYFVAGLMRINFCFYVERVAPTILIFIYKFPRECCVFV